MVRYSAGEARQKFAEILDMVRNGESVEVTSPGQAAVYLVSRKPQTAREAFEQWERTADFSVWRDGVDPFARTRGE